MAIRPLKTPRCKALSTGHWPRTNQSSLLTQLRTGKIGFLSLVERRVPSVHYLECECGHDRETVKHVHSLLGIAAGVACTDSRDANTKYFNNFVEVGGPFH